MICHFMYGLVSLNKHNNYLYDFAIYNCKNSFRNHNILFYKINLIL